MSDSVQMPALGESVTEGTVPRWLKSVGDTVEVDEPLLEVSTDKVDTEIPSPFAGVLEQILVAEDETVEIGAQLAVIGDGSSGGAASSAPEPVAEPSAGAESEPQAPAPAAARAPAAEAAPDQPDSSGGDSGEGTTVSMPALGESVTEGTVTRWLKQQGDKVEVDEPLLEVSTDKVDTEIPSPAAGVLQRIVAGEDETVEVGADLAVIGDEGDGGSDSPAQDSGQDEAAEAPAEEEPAAEPGDSDDAPQYPNQAAEPAAESDSDTSSDSGETAPPSSGGGSGSGS